MTSIYWIFWDFLEMANKYKTSSVIDSFKTGRKPKREESHVTAKRKQRVKRVEKALEIQKNRSILPFSLDMYIFGPSMINDYEDLILI